MSEERIFSLNETLERAYRADICFQPIWVGQGYMTFNVSAPEIPPPGLEESIQHWAPSIARLLADGFEEWRWTGRRCH